jgi:hypothetical protein
LSRSDIERRINLQWSIIDTSSTDSRHFYRHARSIETLATITHDMTHVEDTLENRILDQKFDASLTTFRFRILVEDDLEKLRQETIKLDHVEISRERISHRWHDESFKKNFFFFEADKINREQNSKTKRKRSLIKNEKKEVFF